MFHIYKGNRTAHLLGFSGQVQTDGGLAGGFRAVDFSDARARHAAHAQRDIQRDGAGGDGGHFQMMRIAQTHNGTLAVAFGDVIQGFIEDGLLGLVAFAGGLVRNLCVGGIG